MTSVISYLSFIRIKRKVSQKNKPGLSKVGGCEDVEAIRNIF
jgi:hypothetical protein